jgi:hypothetical protein
MSLPIITPAEGQPIHALMKELEALGGVRHQDFKVVSGLARSAYQVSPELYQKWLEAGGVAAPAQDTAAAEDTEPSTSDAETADAAISSPDAETQSADAATAEETPAEKDGAKAQPAQAEPEAEPKPTPKATTTKRSARSN